MSTGVDIVPSQSDHLEVDDLEEMVSRLGSYGNVPELPAQNSSRSVFFVAPAAVGDGDGSSAGNALVASSTVITDNATANLGDIFVFLNGTYDFNDTVAGLAFLAGVKAFGLGGDLTFISNSNGAATAVMTWAVKNCEVAGFYFVEATATVEGVVASGANAFIHDNIFFGVMENGVHVSNAFSIVDNNKIVNPTNDGIEAESGRCIITRNIIINTGDNGINLNGNLSDENDVHDNIINGGAGTTDYAIQILLGDNNIISGNQMAEVGTWPINDTGSNNGWTDNHYGGSLVGNHDITQAADQVETTITGLDDLDLWKEGHLYISIDATAVVDAVTMTVYLKEKIDNSTYRIVKLDTWNVPAGDVAHPTLDWGYEGGPDKVRCTVVCDGNLAATRNIKWKFKLV